MKTIKINNIEEMNKELKKYNSLVYMGSVGVNNQFVDVSYDGKNKVYELPLNLVNDFAERLEFIGGF